MMPVGTILQVTATNPVFHAGDVGSQIWQVYDFSGRNSVGRLKITEFIDTTHVLVETLTEFDDTATPQPGGWYITASVFYGLINFAGELVGTQLDGSPGGNYRVNSDGSIAVHQHASIIQVGYPYLGMLASHNLDGGGEKGTAQGKIRKLRALVVRFLNSVAARIGTSLWTTRGLVFMEQEDLTDMPVPLYSDVLHEIPDDSWQRTTKQVVIMQDQPAPQTVLSVDVMVECADD